MPIFGKNFKDKLRGIAKTITKGVIRGGIKTEKVIKDIERNIKKLIDEVMIELYGKKIAILGANKVGKTTLASFLLDGEIPTNYKSTGIEKTNENKTINQKIKSIIKELKSSNIDLGDFKFFIKEHRDVPGTEKYIKTWKPEYKSSDYCFYIMDFNMIYQNDNKYIKRVINDLNHIIGFKNDMKNESDENPTNRIPDLIIICSYCDLIEKNENLSLDVYRNIFENAFKEAKNTLKFEFEEVIFGSLNTEDSVRDVVIRIISILSYLEEKRSTK